MGRAIRKGEGRRRLESATWEARALREAMAAAEAVVSAPHEHDSDDLGLAAHERGAVSESAEAIRAREVRLRIRPVR